jgi:hypothetical protein
MALSRPPSPHASSPKRRVPSTDRSFPTVAGSTTFKREDLERGFEPDECFHFGNAAGRGPWTT